MQRIRQSWREKLLYLCSMSLSKVMHTAQLETLQPKRILCIRQDEIGDMCYTLHVFDMLHAQYPEAEITLLCKPFAITLLNNHPAITHLTSNFSDLERHYDIIIDLRGSWRSLWFAITHWPKLRLDRATVRYQNSLTGKHPHEVLTNLQVVAPLITPPLQHTNPRIYASAADRKKAADFLVDHNIGNFAVIHAGARKTLRKWNGYVQLATYLKQRGLDIIFTGDRSEVSEIKNLQQQLAFDTYSVAGLFNLTELSALVSLSKLFVGNESGPLHIAAVSGAPSLGLYGPGEPHVFYPWGKHTAVIHHILECNPCDQITCVHPQNTCMQRIQLQEVVDKVESLLTSH
jgi:ADP-heptose:LPS heptosyltransferase